MDFFARADPEHILLCVDDDMRMEALRQTNYVKSIVTAQGKMDLERKGKQSYQGWMFTRLLAFSCGRLRACAACCQQLQVHGEPAYTG